MKIPKINKKEEKILSSCLRALIVTRDYVGEGHLPAKSGWSWFDTCIELCKLIPRNEWTGQFLIRLKSCPNCKSNTGLKFPRNDSPYCEDCGFPFEDFNINNKEK